MDSKMQSLQNDLMKLITKIYWQACKNEDCEAYQSQDEFHVDAREELNTILQEHGYADCGFNTGGA